MRRAAGTICVVLGLLLLYAKQSPADPNAPPVVAPATPGTAAVYVYEKDDGRIPPAVLAAIDQLKRRGVSASLFERDTRDGAGQVPDQYALAHAEAERVGLPALVITAGGRVVGTLKAPTGAQLLEAFR